LVPAAQQASGSLYTSTVSGGFGQEAEESFSGKGLHSTTQLPLFSATSRWHFPSERPRIAEIGLE